MKYKIYWRPLGEDIARWAIFSEKEDAESYLAALKDCGATAAMIEIPA